ncbi:MAG: hypothetical protein ACK4QW_14040 [Alphaproteobacteria bacterium]
MHYIAILSVLGVVTLATGGHSATFGKAYEAAMRGEVGQGFDLFTRALRSTLKDADSTRADCDGAAKIVLIPTADARAGRC